MGSASFQLCQKGEENVHVDSNDNSDDDDDDTADDDEDDDDDDDKGISYGVCPPTIYRHTDYPLHAF